MSQATDWSVEKFREDCVRLEGRLERLFPWDVGTHVTDGPEVEARITCTVGGVIGYDPELVFVVAHRTWDGDLAGVDKASLQKFWEILPYCRRIEVHLPR